MSLSIRELLKEKTLPLHKELENTQLSKNLVSANLTLDEYIKYLKIMKTIHSQIEAKLIEFKEFESKGIKPIQRCRLNLINKDLEILDASLSLENMNSLEILENFTFEKAVGFMYVLEGSTMGGSFLAPRLQHFKGNNDEVATNYFLAYGKNTLSMWKEFVAFLDVLDEDEKVNKKEIIDSSILLFKYLIEVMDEKC